MSVQSDEDRKAILGVMREVSASRARAKGESEFQKEALKRASEKYQIDMKTLRRMATVYHKGSFAKQVHEDESFQILYSTITGEQLPE